MGGESACAKSRCILVGSFGFGCFKYFTGTITPYILRESFTPLGTRRFFT